jgi:hypothetical protein
MSDILGEAVNFFSTTPALSFPPPIVPGGGVYAIYYIGGFPLYKKLSDLNAAGFVVPIYVGKAVPPGWRTARSTEVEGSVVGRLREHSGSIRQTSNLDINDFRCRFMILSGYESGLIAPIEAALIGKYNPIWNSIISGFGIHAPGKGRYNQAISEWDVLHPGRSFVRFMTGGKSDQTLAEAKIKRYLDGLRLS